MFRAACEALDTGRAMVIISRADQGPGYLIALSIFEGSLLLISALTIHSLCGIPRFRVKHPSGQFVYSSE